MLRSLVGSEMCIRDRMKALLEMSTITPHLLQVNLWSVVHDPGLMELCSQNHIAVQVYNAMNGALGQGAATAAPRAREQLDAAASQVGMPASTVLLGWIAKQGIVSITRTTSMEHLIENSPERVLVAASMLSAAMQDQIRRAVKALMHRNSPHSHPNNP
eukprot:TRINITY_DN46421_c0_g1_i1.p1 TRINITY_DN46421_c0_g1~~TRINITY_DN46421_c0_g1_i1.p1  ORF type:complete len:186 (-),score=56.82 TRINITY_DN46421_c0_g1_i1:203-679(-)